MSLWRDDARSSRVVHASVAALGLLSILSLGRVFASSDYLAWALPAAAVGATFALTFGRRSLLLGFGLLAGVVAFTLPALFARELTFYLFPTRAAWRAVSTLMTSGLSGMMREAAPVPAEQRYLIVTWTAALAGGFLSASWIVVERPIGAVATALGTIAYAGSVGKGAGRDVFGLGAAAMVGVFLLLDGRHRIASWSSAVRRVPSWLGAPTLAAACLVALAGPAVLGAARPWVDVQTALRPRVVLIKPLSDIRKQLEQTPPLEVMRVQASQSSYWRLTALDRYTGTEWLLEAKPVAVRSGRVPRPEPPTRGAVVAQQYSITTLLAPWLPAAYAAQRIEVTLPFEVDRKTSTLLLKDETVPGLVYKVTSRVPDAASPPAGQFDRAEVDPEAGAFAATARSIVGGARSPYEQAAALEAHFRKYTYSEKVEGGHTRQRLQRFLAERRGYCEQFAATMALMLRSLGTPARVAVGFLPGKTRDSRRFVVSTRDAHAWVEAPIPGLGWVQFDPTPGLGRPTGEEEEEQQAPPTAQPAGAAPTPTPASQPERARDAGVPRSRLPVAPVLLAALAVGLVPGAKAMRRHARRVGTPLASVSGAYAELVDRVADLGWRARPHETPWEAWARAFDDGKTPGSSAIAEVVRAAVLSVYGPRPMTEDDALRAWLRLVQGLGELRRSLPRWRRGMALFDPRTFLPAGAPSAQLATG